MSDSLHLERRNGVFYYRRRVPDEAVAAIGKRIIKYSLQTSIKSEARKRREIEDLKWSAHFDSALTESKTVAASSSPSPNASSHETVNLLREYVERVDAKMARAWATDAPSMSRNDVLDVCSEADEDIALLRNASYPPTAERVTRVVHKVLAEGSVEKALSADRQTEELARRALLELARRRLARLEDDHSRPFFDHLFGPSAARQVTFGELCVQYLEEARRDAEINGFSGKRVDKVEDNVALVREIIGENTLTSSVDYDACLRARVLLAETPTNRTKLYPKLTLPEAIERAKLDGKPVLSATTQSQYLETLKGILELATLKTLIPQNPARTLRPLKRDQTSASAKRLPFSLEQIAAFFTSDFYRCCAPNAAKPYVGHNREWRFWLPLPCLFMGMRPNEACQMLVSDVRQTPKGTWYLDVVESSDEDEEGVSAGKTLKTAASRRRIPIHPQLIALGFLKLASGKAASSRLFPTLKPDKYGNLATYALRRFRETFLPEAIEVRPRQTFYSFRHSFRDALRRLDAQPSTLQALGGWEQGALVSDHYGDPMDPDYQAEWIAKVSFHGLDLAFLSSAAH